MSTKTNPLVSTPMSRRGFVASASLALAAIGLGCTRRSEAAAPPAKTGAVPGKVTLVRFDDSGKRLGVSVVDRTVKSDAAWRKQLSPIAYDITRHAGTERAFSGPLLEEHRKGVFRCICCDTALYDAKTKFESGTGWPSFWQPIAAQNVLEIRDSTFGMTRTAISCARCEAHLGHVFDDGPKPTGLRYCMNSAALHFAPAA